jgi:hypothetical protein
VRKALLKDVKQLAEKRDAATRVLVTGDVAFSGKAEKFKVAAQWLDALTKACGCRETDISTIPGNYDCDRKGISAIAKITYGHQRSSSAESAQAQLHDIIKDGKAPARFCRNYRRTENSRAPTAATSFQHKSPSGLESSICLRESGCASTA